MKTKLEFSGVVIDPFDYDYSLSDYPASYLVRLIEKANQLGLEGKKVKAVEVKEEFATNRKYVDLVVL